jgi:glycine/D-amino acid oxidase-like deaminating enzyme
VQNKRLPLVPLTLASLKIWEGLEGKLGRETGFRRSGGFRVATTAEGSDVLRRSADAQEKLGVRIEWLDRSDIEIRAPFLSNSVVSATFSPDDCYATPLLVGPALVDAVARNGAYLFNHSPVTQLHANDSGVEIRTRHGQARCDKAIITSGAWINEVTALLGYKFPVTVDINMVSVTEPAPPTMEGIITHVNGVLTLKQVANGTCLIGGGWKGRGRLESGEKEMDYSSFLHNLRIAVSVVPGLASLNLIRQWSGFEGVTPDSLPIFGALPHHSNVFVSACVRGGWTLSPIFSRLMAELVTIRKTSFDVSSFSPARFGGA